MPLLKILKQTLVFGIILRRIDIPVDAKSVAKSVPELAFRNPALEDGQMHVLNGSPAVSGRNDPFILWYGIWRFVGVVICYFASPVSTGIPCFLERI